MAAPSAQTLQRLADETSVVSHKYLRGHFGCRQGAMTSSGVHHARKSNAADGQKDPQIRKRICETPH